MAFMLNWFWNALSFLGLVNKKAHILFLGLDNAGKTTLLHMLRDGKVVLHEPTRYPQSEELVIGKVSFKTHDLGGHKAARKLWKNYFPDVQGVVFLVDAADVQRFDEAKEELSQLMLTEELQKVPFLILGNKVDLPAAVSETNLKKVLGVDTTGKNGKVAEDIRPIEIFMCSVVKRAGYAEGFRWLSNYL